MSVHLDCRRIVLIFHFSKVNKNSKTKKSTTKLNQNTIEDFVVLLIYFSADD